MPFSCVIYILVSVLHVVWFCQPKCRETIISINNEFVSDKWALLCPCFELRDFLVYELLKNVTPHKVMATMEIHSWLNDHFVAWNLWKVDYSSFHQQANMTFTTRLRIEKSYWHFTSVYGTCYRKFVTEMQFLSTCKTSQYCKWKFSSSLCQSIQSPFSRKLMENKWTFLLG